MNPIAIADKSKDLAYLVLNVGSRMYYLPNSFKYKSVISRNYKFKDIHKGKTCYILGNGPSINQLDLRLLQNKYIFTVNAMICTPLFEKLNPTYHCVLDRKVFQKYKDALIRGIETESTSFFFHRKILEEIGLKDNVYYTYNTLMPTHNNIKIDLTKNASTFINVVPYCIMIAIYMGFDNIVLLGCDFSFFAERKNAHFYEDGKNIQREESLFQDLFGSAIACQQYRYLYEYGKKHHINIVNATHDSFLDVIPRIELRKVL